MLKDRSSHHNGFPVVDHRGTTSDEVMFSQSGTGFMFVTSLFKLVVIGQTMTYQRLWLWLCPVCGIYITCLLVYK